MDYAAVAPMMRHLWSPVIAVSTAWQGTHNAQIAVAVGGASIVPQRPRVVVQIYKRNYTHELITASRIFALNFLKPAQLELMHTLGFASGRGRAKLDGIAYRPGITGSPLLEGCWGYLDCRVENRMDGGDMTCFLADVVDGATLGEGRPLWWQDARSRMPEAWQREWDAKMQAEIAYSLAHMDDVQG